MSTPIRQCPHCGIRSRRFVCCNIVLSERRRWRMTANIIKHVQVFARARKGLDEETYRLNLAAVGATSTKLLTRSQHSELMLRLGRYPDSPKWLTRGEQRAAREQGRARA